MKISCLLFLIIMSVLASCKAADARTCQVSNFGAVLFIGDGSAAYGDLVAYIRSGRFDALLHSASAFGGHLVKLDDTQPYMCLKDRDFATAVQITYPPRSDDVVSAIVKIYFDADQNVRVAEFSVIKKAP